MAISGVQSVLVAFAAGRVMFGLNMVSEAISEHLILFIGEHAPRPPPPPRFCMFMHALINTWLSQSKIAADFYMAMSSCLPLL